MAVYAPDGRLLASVGAKLPAPERIPGGGYAEERWTLMGSVWTIVLRDGRALVFHQREQLEAALPSFLVLLGAGLVALAIGSYPIARHLTRRIEALKETVDAGAGDLSRRIAARGKDEVAVLADSFNRSADHIGTLLSAHKTLLPTHRTNCGHP
ncbi:HAMP domain-containing protein [Mesorhizobium atlanticum]